MHPYEAAIEFLLNEHIRRGDAHSTAEAEKHLAAIAAARVDMDRITRGLSDIGATVSAEPNPDAKPE